MQLDTPIESPGSFWVPGYSDDKIAGVLRISARGEVALELSGAFGDLPTAMRHGRRQVRLPLSAAKGHATRIVGQVRDGGAVTLDGCVPLSTNIQLPSGSAGSMVHVDAAYVGAWYDENEEISFQEITCSLEGLEVWLWANSIEMEYDRENRAGSIRFQMPDDIPLTMPDGVEAKFTFRLTSSGATLPITEASIKQAADLSLQSANAEPVEYFASLAFKFCNFLAFALDQGVNLRSMTGFVDILVADNQTRRQSVHIYGQLGPENAKHGAIRGHEALFLYPNVADLIDTLIENWLEVYETFAPAISLYFASKNETTAYFEMKILWLAQALETLHRRTSDETALAEEEFERLVESIMRNCTEEERRWLQEKLRYANEPSFRARVGKLIEPFKNQLGNSDQRRTLINRICDTRNYLTHYDEATTPNRAVEPMDLVELRDKMEALFQLHLLGRIGFERPVIDDLVAKNHRLRRKLNPTARG